MSSIHNAALNWEELITKYDNLINEVKRVAPDSKLVVTAVADRIYPGSTTINQNACACYIYWC